MADLGRAALLLAFGLVVYALVAGSYAALVVAAPTETRQSMGVMARSPSPA